MLNNETLNYFFYGPKNDEMNRNYKNEKDEGFYRKDTINAIAATHLFEGKVVQTEDPHKRIVDGAIEVISVTPEEREGKAEFWKKKTVSMWVIILGSTAFAVSVIALSFFLKLYVGLSAPWISRSLVILNVAFASLGGIRWYQARGYHQNLWQDFIDKVCEDRKMIKELGYEFAHKSFSNAIHPEEKSKLWEKWHDDFFQNFNNYKTTLFSNPHFDSGDKIRKIDKFFAFNPYGNKPEKVKNEQTTEVCKDNVKTESETVELSPFEEKFKELSTKYLAAKNNAIKQEKKIHEDKNDGVVDNNKKLSSFILKLNTSTNELISKDKDNETHYNAIRSVVEERIKSAFSKLADDIDKWTVEMIKTKVSDERLLVFIKPVSAFTDAVVSKNTDKLKSIEVPKSFDEKCPNFKDSNFFKKDSYPIDSFESVPQEKVVEFFKKFVSPVL